jgi:hypothetical protein
MILNAYAVLDVFTVGLRILSGLVVVGLGLLAWFRWKGTMSSERRRFLEDRSYFLFLLAVLLVILNLASWPFFYLLLQSYVPEYRSQGVMCIYGVTQIGAGSLGASRFLPGLITILQLAKPALVFLTGCWFVLYLVNRRTATAPLMSRVLLILILMGIFAVLDAAVEGAYLAIPKNEDFPVAGCCTLAFDSNAPALHGYLENLLGEAYGLWIGRAYYGINAAMCLALAIYLRRPRWRLSGPRLVPLAMGALVILAVNLLFLIEVAAPALLHLPDHHCPYDLIPEVPESLVAVALFVAGSFVVGWGCLAVWLGNVVETRPVLRRMTGRLLRIGLWAYVGSVVMLSVEMGLAIP